MKCPQCGQWNKASLPRCFRCGAELPKQPDYLRNVEKDWQFEVEKSQEKQKTYIEVDDVGEQQELKDKRDLLAQEMVTFKERKRRGEKEQKRLREQGMQKGFAPSSRTLRRNINRENFFSIDDDPSTALRPRPAELMEEKGLDTDAYMAFTSEYEEGMGELPLPKNPGHFNEIAAEDPFVTTTILEDTQQLYDGFDDTFAYEPLWQDAQHKGNYNTTSTFTGKKIPSTRMGFRKFFRFFLIAFLAGAVAFSAYSVITLVHQRKTEQQAAAAPIVMASILNDQAAHTIRIPGKEGSEIYIRERQTAYPVVDGIAEIEIPDHIWFENERDLQPTKTVSLTPYIKLPNGDLDPMAAISYTVEIPLSQIVLLTPDGPYAEVSKSLYTIQIQVEPGSKLSINGEDISDLVNQEGIASHNATIQPIGDNVFTIRAKSEYARENTLQLIIHRTYQEIPLDLSATLPDRTTDETLTISATTLTGAKVNVLSSHQDLDVSRLNIDGTFTFTASFDRYGKNTISITADFEGKQQSLVNYDVVYVPRPEKYTSIARDMKDNYSHFLNNSAVMVEQRKIYLCKGVITEFVNAKPQLAIMNVGSEESPLEILVENGTQTTWELDTSYELYADAYGLYGQIPRLTARYTYPGKETKKE